MKHRVVMFLQPQLCLVADYYDDASDAANRVIARRLASSIFVVSLMYSRHRNIEFSIYASTKRAPALSRTYRCRTSSATIILLQSPSLISGFHPPTVGWLPSPTCWLDGLRLLILRALAALNINWESVTEVTLHAQ